MPTRTTTFATNDVLTANDLNALAGAWNAYTPTLAQGASSDIAKTVVYAKYLQFGKLVIAQVQVSATGTGTAGEINLTLPVTAARSSDALIGSGIIYDASATAIYHCSVSTRSFGTKVSWENDASGATKMASGFALASGDAIAFTAMYEAA